MSDENRVRRLWLDIFEAGDRTSPSEYPGMALITFDEFKAALDYVGIIVRAEEREAAADLAEHLGDNEIAAAIRGRKIK